MQKSSKNIYEIDGEDALTCAAIGEGKWWKEWVKEEIEIVEFQWQLLRVHGAKT